MHLERPGRGDDVSSVVDVIPSTSQDMALQTIVSRPHHLISPLQTVIIYFFNLEVAMLLKGFLTDCLIDCYECTVLCAVAGSRAKEPFDSDSARGPLLHEAAGVRTALHSLTESDTPRSQAGKHAAQ